MRERYVYREGLGVVNVLDLDPVEESKRSALAAPMIISDNMAPVRSMADGKVYDSKSSYERGVRDKGCRIVGNDRLESSTTQVPRVGHDIKRAIEQLKAG
ncbi:hypothetical protein [Caulobacter sp. UC70_42]|uniref:hypothetical protein n=1 Tax=Caulobacter sp. UC70_42 TaxID=3374551 RepID=UPI003757D408